MKILAYKRKLRIKDTVKEMLELEEMLLDAISNRGRISDKQRATVLKNVVDKMKRRSKQRVEDLALQLSEAERSDDIIKSIML